MRPSQDAEGWNHTRRECLDDDNVIAQGDALQQLIAAMQACRDARIERAEILEIVRPHLPDDDGITIEGALMEHLSDRDAATIIRVAYGTLLSGATFSFIDGRRSREEIRRLCEEADVGNPVEISREGRSRRVSILKPPS